MGKKNPDQVAGVKSNCGQFRAEPGVSSGTGPKQKEHGPALNGGALNFFDRLAEADALATESLADDCAPCGATADWRAIEANRSRPGSGFAFQDAIGRELRNLYEDIVAQPIPDRFFSLISQLENNMLSSGASPRGPGEGE